MGFGAQSLCPIPMNKTLSVGSVNMILWAAHCKGVPQQAIIDAFGIDPVILNDPDNRLAIKTVQAIWQEVIAYSQMPNIPVCMGEIINPVSVGILAYIMMHSPTMGKAIDKLCQYQDIACNAVMTIQEHTEQQVILKFEINSTDIIYPHYAVESEMSVYISAFRALSQSDFPLDAIYLMYPPTADVAEYQRVFGCPVYFNSSENKMIFSKSLLERRIINANPLLFNIFEQHAQDLLAQLQPKEAFSDIIRVEIVKSLKGEEPSLGNIAKQLGIGIRSIQQKLKAEGITFQQLLEQSRKELAIKHLQQVHSSTTDIAYLLGYSDPSVFFRSFKKWTGQTPTMFRNRLLV